MNSVIVVLSHVDERRKKLQENIFKALKDSNITYGIAVPSNVDTTTLNGVGDIIQYDSNATIATVKNQIIKTYKGVAKYIHIIEDDMVLADSAYISKVEEFMEFLNLPIFASTTPENQNCVFGILTPRLSLTDIKTPFDKVDFYSNEAKCYICINLYNFNDRYYFDETMNYFYLSYNYWKRHHTDHSVPFLNFYPSFPDEAKMLYRDISIPSHITQTHVKDAAAEVQKTNIKWESEPSIDGPIQLVMNSINLYKHLH